MVPVSSSERKQFVQSQVALMRDAAWQAFTEQSTPADAVALAYATNMTALVQGLYARACHEAPQASASVLVALGSLSRGDLLPYADLDLVLVCDRHDAHTQALADAFYYPLWDARLDVGHGVRSVKDFAALAAQDPTVTTSVLDARVLAGDPALAAQFQERMAHALGQSSVRERSLAQLQAWLAEDHPATIYQLQPDIKAGPGGLRDIHRVRWAARQFWAVHDWEALAAHDATHARDVGLLRQGHRELLALRLAMQRVTKRKVDQLRFDLEDDVAALLNVMPLNQDLSAGDELLRRYFATAKSTRTAARHVLARCVHSAKPNARATPARDLGDFLLHDGGLMFRDPAQPTRSPVDLLKIFRVAQLLRVPLHVQAREQVTQLAPTLLTPELLGQPGTSRLVVDLLSEQSEDGHVLELLHELGVLARVLCELTPVTGLAQRDLYHTYTVDAHLVFCARQAIRVLSGAADTPPDIAEVASHVTRPHLLILAALYHDIGKGRGHGHSEHGAVLAQQAAARLMLSNEDKEDLAFLVLEHLSLFKLSQRRDLEDAELLARLANKVETLERLDLLFLLSYIDAVTTGPEAWTQWKAALLRELYARTRTALVEGAAAQSQKAHAEARLGELLALLGPSGSDVARELTRLSPRHLVAHRPALLKRHLEALQQAGSDGICVSVAPDAERGFYEIVAVGKDKPGLLADLAGALAASGVNVDAAQISSTNDGFVVDTFVVGSHKSAALEDPPRQQRMLERLRAALRGESDFQASLNERKRAAQAFMAFVPPQKPRVVFDLQAARDATVVDFFAHDRVGLLHDVAHAIFGVGASITLARINTEANRAVDALYVVDARTGQPLVEAQREQLQAALLAAAYEAS